MSTDEMKRKAARAALDQVESGMRLGLGSGTTSEAFIDLLGERVRQGLDVVGVPTSEKIRAQAEALGIRLTTLDETPELDLAIDGADEIGPGLTLIKGGGGALLREKIVATAARAMLVIADERKLVDHLGAFPLPVEVVPFGLGATRRAMAALAARLGLAGEMTLRQDAGHVFVTDGGHHILDCHFQRLDDPAALAAGLNAIPGVVEHGLFIGIARAAWIAGAAGVRRLEPA
jgi:ribose 5-phosphate isomerase A